MFNKVFNGIAIVLILISTLSFYQVYKIISPTDKGSYSTICNDQVVLGHRVGPNGQFTLVCDKRT